LHDSGEDGQRERLVVLATADAPARIGANSWQAALLQAEAPPGALDEAVAALRAVVSGADLTAEAAQKASAPAVRDLLAGARQALAALPTPRPVAAPPRDVLAGLNPKGKGEMWLLSSAALQPWRRLDLPELQDQFWK
jgi:hypothetical protein